MEVIAALITVIPTAGRPGLLERTLKSLAACRLPDEYRRTVVIENGPRSGAEQIVRNCPASLRAQYLYHDEANKSRTLNRVLEAVDDCLIFFTDDDVRFAVNLLGAYAEAAGGAERGRVFGGPLGVDYETPPQEWLKPYLPRSAVGWNLDTRDAPSGGEAPIFLGANWAAFSPDLKDAGGFNPERGPGAASGSVGQETEMQHRLFARGVKPVYVPEAMVWHYVPARRCSVDYALNWAYRLGLERGLEHRDESVTLLRFPRWLLWQWLKRGFRLTVRNFSPNRQVRFEARREFRLYSGMLMGCRYARLNNLQTSRSCG